MYIDGYQFKLVESIPIYLYIFYYLFNRQRYILLLLPFKR